MAEQMVTILDRENTLLNRFIAQMRDINIQGDSMRFRRNLERAGEVMAYEISKTLEYKPQLVETPLGEAEVMMPDDEIVIATILRAGLPFHQGFLTISTMPRIPLYRPTANIGKTTHSTLKLSTFRLVN